MHVILTGARSSVSTRASCSFQFTDHHFHCGYFTTATALLSGVAVTETGSSATRTVEIRDLFLTTDPAHPERAAGFHQGASASAPDGAGLPSLRACMVRQAVKSSVKKRSPSSVLRRNHHVGGKPGWPMVSAWSQPAKVLA